MKLQLKRLVSQIILLITANLGGFGIKTGFCYPFFYCQACPSASAACPLRAIEQSVYKGSLTWRFLVYPMMILGFAGVLSGRLVCAWACPIGFLQRGTAHVARRFNKSSFAHRLGKSALEKNARYIKYLMFLGLVVITSILIGFVFTDICPVGFLTGTIPTLILNPGRFIPGGYFWVALVIFIFFLILIFTIERGWCRYFCPVGAFLAPFNKISVLHVAVDTKGCIHCNACSKVCPMGIDVPTMNRSPECILCGKCVSICPKQVISFKGLST